MFVYIFFTKVPNVSAMEDQLKYAWSPLPTRQNMIDSLKKDEFDVLVIGGGATGCGVALDAVSRGKCLSEKYSINYIVTCNAY